MLKGYCSDSAAATGTEDDRSQRETGNGLRKALWTVRQYRKLAGKMPLTLLVLGRWRSVKSFIGLKSKFISQVLLCSGEIELMNQVEFPCAALLELTD